MNSAKFFRLCHKCSKEGVNYSKCDRCKIAYYCSRECQVNNWCEHKYICNLTKKSHSVLTDNLNFIITNVKFILLLQALIYHFLSENDDQFLMCILSKSFDDENFYQCSFLINHVDNLRDKKLTIESKLVWLIFKDDENNTSEGGFRFNLKECNEYYDELKELINFDEVYTMKDIPIEGAEVSFDGNIQNHCKALMADDVNKCLFYIMIMKFCYNTILKVHLYNINE